jgi:hypothetical protein
MASTRIVPKAAIPGSRQNILAKLERAERLAGMVETDARPLVECCRALREFQAWDTYFDDDPKTWERLCVEVIRYDAEFIAEIEAGVAVLESRGHVGPIPAEDARQTAQQLAADPSVKRAMTRQEAGAKGGRGIKAVANSHFFPANKQSSTSANRLVRRLKRDAPEIAQALANGEYKSARSAAIAAGIVKVPTPLEAAMKAAKKLSTADRRKLMRWLRSQSRTTKRE